MFVRGTCVPLSSHFLFKHKRNRLWLAKVYLTRFYYVNIIQCICWTFSRSFRNKNKLKRMVSSDLSSSVSQTFLKMQVKVCRLMHHIVTNNIEKDVKCMTFTFLATKQRAVGLSQQLNKTVAKLRVHPH